LMFGRRLDRLGLHEAAKTSPGGQAGRSRGPRRCWKLGSAPGGENGPAFEFDFAVWIAAGGGLQLCLAGGTSAFRPLVAAARPPWVGLPGLGGSGMIPLRVELRFRGAFTCDHAGHFNLFSRQSESSHLPVAAAVGQGEAKARAARRPLARWVIWCRPSKLLRSTWTGA
jgi:hypothetical protein